MRRPETSFALAGCVSLAVHAALFVALPRFRVADPEAEPPASGEPLKPLTVVLVPEAPAPPEEPLEKFAIGDQKGTGFASHEVKDPVEATAPEADVEQAYLSLDPSGAGESGSDAAVHRAEGKGSTRGQPGGAPPPLVAQLLAPPTARSLVPFGLNPELKIPRLVPRAPSPSMLTLQSAKSPVDGGAEEVAQAVTTPAPPIAPTPPAPVPPEATVSPTPPQPTVAPVPSPAVGGSTPGGSQHPAADPARMSESESDPFSKLGAATFKDGALNIRFGRKVKTRRPKLLLAGQVDLLSLRQAKVVLRIDIDAAGKVTGVKVVKSSGSNEIDQPTRVAVYDWWFEPKTDDAGQPVADSVEFTISWR